MVKPVRAVHSAVLTVHGWAPREVSGGGVWAAANEPIRTRAEQKKRVRIPGRPVRCGRASTHARTLRPCIHTRSDAAAVHPTRARRMRSQGGGAAGGSSSPPASQRCLTLRGVEVSVEPEHPPWMNELLGTMGYITQEAATGRVSPRSTAFPPPPPTSRPSTCIRTTCSRRTCIRADPS